MTYEEAKTTVLRYFRVNRKSLWVDRHGMPVVKVVDVSMGNVTITFLFDGKPYKHDGKPYKHVMTIMELYLLYTKV